VRLESYPHAADCLNLIDLFLGDETLGVGLDDLSNFLRTLKELFKLSFSVLGIIELPNDNLGLFLLVIENLNAIVCLEFVLECEKLIKLRFRHVLGVYGNSSILLVKVGLDLLISLDGIILESANNDIVRFNLRAI